MAFSVSKSARLSLAPRGTVSAKAQRAAAPARKPFHVSAAVAPDQSFQCEDADEGCIADWIGFWNQAQGREDGERGFFVGGNWKMNGNRASIAKLVDDLNKQDIDQKVEVVCAPPTIYLSEVEQAISPNYKLSAQNSAAFAPGAFTGETAVEMLKDMNIPWVILGHSERRTLFGETSEDVGKKTAYAINGGLEVMACIGETLDEREAGDTLKVCFEQLQAIADEVTIPQWMSIVIAYEPVWAIGTGKVATKEQAQEVHAGIRQWIMDNVSPAVASSVRILYGGSVKPDNADELAAQPDIDGFLVGGASLDASGFASICNAGKVKAA